MTLQILIVTPGASLSNLLASPAAEYRALEFSRPGHVAVVSRATRALGKGEIRIDVTATGVCGSDIHGIEGGTGRREIGQVMGHESCGVVTEVGPGVDKEMIGTFGAINPVVSCGACDWCEGGQQQVCRSVWILGVRADIDAAFAEEVVVPSEAFVPLNGLDDRVLGSLVEPLAVGFHAVKQAHLTDSSRVLVIGAGPIGQAAALGANHSGCGRLIVLEPNEARRAVASGLRIETCDSELTDEEVLAHLGGRPNVVIDAVGASATLNRALALSEPRAEIVLVGMAQPDIALPAYSVSTGERRIFGSYCYSRNSFLSAAHWLETNQETASRMLDKRVPIEEAPGVIHEMAMGNLKSNKAVIVL